MIKRQFFDWCAEHFKETFIVPGNHEFYHGYDIGQTMENYEFAYRNNVRYLNNRSAMIGGTELFFTTLWTRIDPLHLWEIQRGMNDFKHGVLDGKRFCANDVDGLHERCLHWLETALAASKAKHNGKIFETLAKMDFRYLSTEVIGGFTGVMLGVFTQGETTNGVADFDWFEYN